MVSLPLELERLIFEMAALQDTNHDSRVRILLVAKRVHEWYVKVYIIILILNSFRRVRPIVYRVAIARVVPDGGVTIPNWRNAQITDVAPFARYLLVGSSPASLIFSTSHLIELLSALRNVENLAIWLRSFIVPRVLKEMNNLPLRVVSFGPADISLDEAINDCPALRNITHLEIVSMKGLAWNDVKVLIEFPNLTHLCFEIKMENGVILDLLRHCPSLQAMICLKLTLLIGDCTIESDDPRFLVLRDGMELGDFVQEWERSANGDIGLWELADIIIEARKGEVHSFCLVAVFKHPVGKLFKDNSSSIFLRKTWVDNLNEDGMRWYLQNVAHRM